MVKADTINKAWRAQVLTLYPDMFPGPLGASLAGRGLDEGLWSLDTFNIRDFAHDRHASVDDTPYGGGSGMVMRADVVDGAIDAAFTARPELPLVYVTPKGRPIDQGQIQKWAKGPGITLLCGRFEGIDQRLLDLRKPEEISLGDFVLSGGEPAAMAIIDAAVRLLPGIVGSSDSLAEESFEDGLLEYPHYTRPREWQGLTVPDVLLSGHHKEIQAWRKTRAEDITRNRRPDLWARYRDHNETRSFKH